MARYIEVKGIDGQELLFKIDAIKVVRRTEDGRAVVDEFSTRARYEDLKATIAGSNPLRDAGGPTVAKVFEAEGR